MSLKVLFLPRWYPNRFDPMPGLFIQRQVEALVDFCEVAVLSVHPVQDAPNNYEIDVAWENGVFNVRVYYSIPGKKNRFLSISRFVSANMRGLRLLKTYKPDIVHVQVLTRLGIIALWNRIRKGTPYVISEHWSRYFAENDTYKGSLRKFLTKLVVRNSGALITVSYKLKRAMESHGIKANVSEVIPNIVDSTFFTISNNPTQPLTRRIVHVSCFEDKSKNITGFLRAIKKVTETRKDFVADMIGEGPDLDKCRSYAASLGLKENVVFHGMKKDKDLVSIMNTADFLVLSSRYETFGTVILESLTCGVPVVTTDVGIAKDVISKNNGIVVPPEDDDKLAEAVLFMLKNCRQYDRESIRSEITSEYSASSVGKKIMEIYERVLKRKTAVTA